MTLKQRIRRFLGIDSLPGMEMFMAHEQEERRRFRILSEKIAEITEKQGEIFNALAALRSEMIVSRVFEKPRPMPTPTDWEQVTVNELYSMIEKEHDS
jgi:hypothetical protein